MKRFCSMVLAIACLLTMIPFTTVSAATTSDGFTFVAGKTYRTITGYTGSEKDIIIPSKINGDPVTDIASWAFENKNIKSVTIGDIPKIGACAFWRCYALTDVTISGKVNTIAQGAFSKCEALERVNVTDLEVWCGISFENETSNPLYYAKNLYVNGELLTELVIPDGVTSIGDYAFSDCSALTSVVIPDSVTSIGDYAFYNTAITSVTIPNSVWSIGADAFGGCAALTDVYYEGSASAWEMLAATDPVPSSVTVHILGEENYDNNVLAMLNYTTYADGTACINGYYGTESYLLIPSEIKGYTVTAIGEKAFLSNSNLTHVIIPDSVTSIGDQAFALCDNIISIEIGNSVTSIGNNAFDFCESLQSLTIPKSVTSIGEYAIWNCTNLTDIYYEGSREEWDQNVQKHLYLSIQPGVTIHYDWAELSQGDLTGDGIVDMFDAMALYTAVSGAGTLTEAQQLAADINADGTIDMFDALALYIQVSGQ